MKKIFCVALMIFALWVCLGTQVHGEAYSDNGEQVATDDYGQNEILEALPNDVQNKLESEGITPDNQGALKLNPMGVIKKIWQVFIENVSKPLKFLLSMTGIALLCSLANSINVDKNAQLSQNFAVVSILAGAGIIISAIGETVVEITTALSQGANFMLAFIPVFAGFMATSGQLTSAGVFNGIFLTASQLFSQIGVNFLLPISSTILGISIAGTVNSEIKVENIARTIKVAINWILGLLMTVFIGLLSVQSLVANSADSVLMKTTKFAVSSGVPIVGSSVAEAVGAVYTSVSLIKNSVGTFGIIAAIVLVAPPILTLLSYKLAVMLSSGVCELFGANQLASMLKSAGEVLSITFAVLICFIVISVISIGFMLMLGSGVVA